MFRIYVTDALKALASNTTRQYGGTELNRRYVDIITPQKEETRTQEEIVDNIRRKLKGN